MKKYLNIRKANRDMQSHY